MNDRPKLVKRLDYPLIYRVSQPVVFAVALGLIGTAIGRAFNHGDPATGYVLIAAALLLTGISIGLIRR